MERTDVLHASSAGLLQAKLKDFLIVAALRTSHCRRGQTVAYTWNGASKDAQYQLD